MKQTGNENLVINKDENGIRQINSEIRPNFHERKRMFCPIGLTLAGNHGKMLKSGFNFACCDYILTNA